MIRLFVSDQSCDEVGFFEFQDSFSRAGEARNCKQFFFFGLLTPLA